MENYRRAHYELRYEVRFLKSKGNTFQDFFSEIMEKGYPNDFQRVRPWGNIGDRKNDGYIASTRQLFQVYAPNEVKPARTIAKIEEDYKGAYPYWKDYFDHWTFVHNSREGLGSEVAAKILDLKQKTTFFSINTWGFEELRTEVFKLKAVDLASLLGTVPGQGDITELRIDEIKVLIDRLAAADPISDENITPPPSNKLYINGLSGNVKTILRSGMIKSDLVGKLFNRGNEQGDKVGAVLKQRYDYLKAQNLVPDDIFLELQKFVGGEYIELPKYQVARDAILAYYFQQCTIFEAEKI